MKEIQPETGPAKKVVVPLVPVPPMFDDDLTR